MSASAASTPKNLSSNFTLVNLVDGVNNGEIQYVKDNGTQWIAPQTFTLTGLGAQLIKRQYDPADGNLSAGSGSVVVSTDGPVGAVVQIQARAPQVPTFGAYIGVSEGAATANVPLAERRLGTLSGTGNSQIIVQNASSGTINVDIVLIDGKTGATTFTHHITGLVANQSSSYDLDDESAANVPDGWFGSAKVTSVTAGGAVAVVSNLFSGPHAMQTFNAFTTSKSKWGVPLFAIRLANGLSTPVAVQNAGDTPIPVNGVTLSCVKDPSPASIGPATISVKNGTAIGKSAAFFFNPAADTTNFPDALWFGACTVDAGSFQTASFVQLRTIGGDRAAAHEGIPLDSTNKIVVLPLYAKRLTNGFATAITILNLSSSADAHVSLAYKGGTGTAAGCTTSFSKVIPKGGSLIQNLRVNGTPTSVDVIPDNCFGTLTVTSSDQAIDAFAQLDLLDALLPAPPGGDPFQAHNAFTLAGS